MVAVFSLLVNIMSAWLLRDDHHRDPGHEHRHDQGHRQDKNLNAGYLLVFGGRIDIRAGYFCSASERCAPLILGTRRDGHLYAIVNSRWSWGSIKNSGFAMLERMPASGDVKAKVRDAVKNDRDTISDLHNWQIGPGRYSFVVSIASDAPNIFSKYKVILDLIN
ncbi:MAG: hypothetical protein AAF066_11090 [Pseudomonadota bacterium]